MCLAVPGKLIEIDKSGSMIMGRIDYSGTIQTACLEYIPEVEIGQYVLIHAGFAISIVQEDEAKKSLELFAELARINDEEQNQKTDDTTDENS